MVFDMRNPSNPAHLFKTRQASVTPSWVRFRNTSYAVRTITRLSLRKSSGPHPSMHALVIVFLCLALYSAVQVNSGAILSLIGWALVGLSILLALFTASLTYFQQTLFRVAISMYDGTSAFLIISDEQEANNLHDAITRAMDWHRQPGHDLDIGRKVVSKRALAKDQALLDEIL